MTQEIHPSSPPVYSVPSPWRRLGMPIAAALASGVLLAAAFPPLEWWPAAFLGMLPLLLTGLPVRNSRRILCGAVFGLSHWLLNLWWLNTVGFGAGCILALICTLFVIPWYWMLCVSVRACKPKEILTRCTPEERRLAHLPGTGLRDVRDAGRYLRLALAFSAFWVALEWLRSWAFSGFPWDQLGISQAFVPTRMLATLAGVYGISFAIVLVNFLLAGLLLRRGRGIALWTALAILTGFSIFHCISEGRAPFPQEVAPVPLRVIAIQGNVPECREWNDAVFLYAWKSYAGLTMQACDVSGEDADFYLWPEGALPCQLTFPEYARGLQLLLAEVNKPLLMGALDERHDLRKESSAVYNTAFLLDRQTQCLVSPYAPRGDHYDKIHLVPFGEYVPFSRYAPWLNELLGLGRDLTPGKDFRLFKLPRKDGSRVPCGVNICFEDAFPEISRRFVLEGAQVLMTITNDCWYGTSAGARQHLAHAVFRAVETRRPLLRSGNNSDTCLISHDGKLQNAVTGAGGERFCAGWRRYEFLPCRENAPLTLYTRTGNLFAWGCAIAAVLHALLLARKEWRRKKNLAQMLVPEGN